VSFGLTLMPRPKFAQQIENFSLFRCLDLGSAQHSLSIREEKCRYVCRWLIYACQRLNLYKLATRPATAGHRHIHSHTHTQRSRRAERTLMSSEDEDTATHY